ncbi:NAD-dependent epimerase/dehydratase family protein [Phycisphaerales bacterium AB-hyl4]|uniref:NAD-dependent epimerase/dehydratase family protein n=1 Tax=Natronomicrosphaera hydrolytica TaxID=3242702 RepID=A0ABV4U6P5_9BACT
MGPLALITGGAGFIGSHLADALLREGYRVRVLDRLQAQVHGPRAQRPTYLADDVELMQGDVCDPLAVRRAVQGAEVVYHLAARVGVGQSMYQVADYTVVNDAGTAVLLEAMLQHPVRRLIVASSMSIYGEGRYRDASGGFVDDAARAVDNMKDGRWEPTDTGGQALTAVPTPESKPARLASVYALNKHCQEQLCLVVGRAYGIATVALRFFNVYGPRQALSNPYTGVLAIFASRLLNGRPPIVYEDGQQRRDFVSVYDVARACVLAMDAPLPSDAPAVFNIGSGQPRTVVEVAERLAAVLQRRIEPRVSGEYRQGDIRHCFADIERARRVLGYEPRVAFEDGLAELATWLSRQPAEDQVDRARAELSTRGLTA